MQRRLDTTTDFVTPTGELIKEGKIRAISSMTNQKADRYMFLVSNLICENYKTGEGILHMVDI